MYQSLTVPVHYAGIISMIIAGGTVISSIFSEKIIKRLGTGIVTVISVSLTAGALISFSFSYSFIAVCLCAIPLGLGAGSVDAALNNYVALHYKAKHMSWLHCFWGVGASIGPLIMSAYLMHGIAWNVGYRTIGGMQLFLVILLSVSLPLWKKKTAQQQEKTTSSVLTFKELLKITGVKQILIAFFCYCSIESITGLWGSSYMVQIKQKAPDIASRWIAWYYIGITFGRFISGFLTILLTSTRMIRVGQGLIAGGIIALLLPFDPLVLPGFFMIGLGCAPIFPSLLHETPKHFGTEYSQAIMGIQMASAYIGTTLMPPLFGRIAAHVNFALFPFYIGILLIIKIIMVETVHIKIKNHPVP
jgi:fucose permease